MTAAERDNLRRAMDAMQRARSMAKARGLTDAQIADEEEDDDSQYWDDVAEIAAALRAERGKH
jgi:hypothetical protein